MAKPSANIASPEVIQRFRAQFIVFDAESRRELGGIQNAVRSVQNWVQVEQASHWKSELRKRHEVAEATKRAYTMVRNTGGKMKKDDIEEERKAMVKAKRRLEEAEEKLETIKKWTLILEREAVWNVKPCVALASRLLSLTPKAIHRLDQMLDNLDIYLRPASPKPSGGSGKSGSKDQDESCPE